MRTLGISPHLDDFALSCGQYLDGTRQYGETVVYTVLAGVPPEGTATGYDLSTGWESSTAAILGRKEEDLAALQSLGARPTWGDLLDSQYGATVEMRDVADRVWAAIDTFQPDLLIVPVGIRHPDHVAVADGCAIVVRDIVLAHEPRARVEHVLLYEEQPYRVMYPEVAFGRARWWNMIGDFDQEAQPAGSMDAKQEAVRSYASQMVALEPDLPCCWVPERFHRLRRDA